MLGHTCENGQKPGKTLKILLDFAPVPKCANLHLLPTIDRESWRIICQAVVALAHIGGQVLMSEGKTCLCRMSFTNPGTRLLLINTTCYLIGKTPRRLTTKAYDVLLYAQCISHPVAIGAGITECLLTDEGRAAADTIHAEMCKYCQLDLFTEEDDAA